MSAESQADCSARQAALELLVRSAARNVPGAEFAGITVRREADGLSTLAATEPLAERADALQYELREGPCLAAVAADRFVLVNDMAAAGQYPRYSPRAVKVGIAAQAAVQLLHDDETAGLLARTSQARNIELRTLAQHVIDGTFTGAPREVQGAQEWP